MTHHRIKTFIYKNAGLLAILWSFVIFILCATPGQYIPSATWLEMLSFDKFVHAFIFLVLCSLFFLMGLRQGRGAWFFTFFFLLGVLYGAFLEWMQANYFSNRSSDWYDIAANTFGCVLALLLKGKLKKLTLSD